jgi:hypothetical protein
MAVKTLKCRVEYLLGLVEQGALIIIDHQELRSFPAPQAIATVTSWEKPPVWGVAQQAKYLERASFDRFT